MRHTAEVAEQMQITSRNVLNQKARAVQILRSALIKKSLLRVAVTILFFIFSFF